MLYESQVVEAICSMLRSHRYDVVQCLTRTSTQGYDIIAWSPAKVKLVVEAKGETSERETRRPWAIAVFDFPASTPSRAACPHNFDTALPTVRQWSCSMTAAAWAH